MSQKKLIKRLLWPSRQYIEDRLKEQKKITENGFKTQGKKIEDLEQIISQQNELIVKLKKSTEDRVQAQEKKTEDLRQIIFKQNELIEKLIKSENNANTKFEQYSRQVFEYKNEISGRIFEQLPEYMAGLNTIPREKKIIVSLTSYPRRISFAAPCIYTLLHQSYKPDEVILWLANDEFPNHEDDLPQELTALKKYGLSIRWCEQLGPHKKYYYAMQEYPDDIVITVDDDVLYPAALIERLYKAYIAHPACVCAVRARQISFADKTLDFMPYNDWKLYETGGENGPSFALLPTGVGGVLYPPHCLDESVFDLETIKKQCLYTDDLWLKLKEVKRGTKVYKIAWSYPRILYVEGSQENALTNINMGRNQNDLVIGKLLDHYKNDPDKEKILNLMKGKEE